MLLHLLGRGATPEQVRDTLTVCFIGLAALGRAGAGRSPARPRCRTRALVAGLVPGVALAHVLGRRGFTHLAAGEHYERVLTGVMVVAIVVGLLSTLG